MTFSIHSPTVVLMVVGGSLDPLLRWDCMSIVCHKEPGCNDTERTCTSY